MSLACLIADPEAWEQKRQAYLDELRAYPTGAPMPPPPSLPPLPDPRPFPIVLTKDHATEVQKNLELVRDELRFVSRRPSNWWYPVVGMYGALGHALVLRLGKEAPAPPDPLHHLTALYSSAVARGILPRSRVVERSVEELERIRASYLTLGVSEWPVGPTKLLGAFDECLSVVLALTDGMAGEMGETIRECGDRLRRKVRELAPPRRTPR